MKSLSLSYLMTTGAAAVISIGLSASTARADANPMLGDLMPVGFNFCPRGWALADGQLLAISSNQSLYSLLGTMYGGDGRTTFALPDLRSRMPVHVGTNAFGSYVQGQRGGAPTATMTTPTMPAHSHLVNATNAQGDTLGPGNDYLADPNTNDPNTELHIYHDGGVGNQIMNSAMISNTGGGQSFTVQDPYQVINWCIALQGIFPSRN